MVDPCGVLQPLDPTLLKMANFYTLVAGLSVNLHHPTSFFGWCHVVFLQTSCFRELSKVD